ncbi:phage tail protein [Microbacterium laevaniformans]|uniref:phage tail protein n=1 Tax=Microbacterium laevaniformans TaxID=36807 RepID=UPI003627645A
MASISRRISRGWEQAVVLLQFTVADLSGESGQPLDAFDVADLVTVVDDELDLRVTQRVLKVEHDVIRPWTSKVTLSGKLRELGNRSATEAGVLTTGISSGVSVADGMGTGDDAARFTGPGVRWIEQTCCEDGTTEVVPIERA